MGNQEWTIQRHIQPWAHKTQDKPRLYVSLDCPFLIATSVFTNVYLLPTVCLMSCVPKVVCFSGLSDTGIRCHTEFVHYVSAKQRSYKGGGHAQST
jgi:hypothetical protein